MLPRVKSFAFMAKWIPSMCTLWCSWLRHCAASRRFMASILDGVPRILFRPQYGPAVDSASNSTEYRGYFLGCKSGRCLGLTTLPPSCGDCLEIWELQPPRTLGACPALYGDCFMNVFYHCQLIFLFDEVTVLSVPTKFKIWIGFSIFKKLLKTTTTPYNLIVNDR